MVIIKCHTQSPIPHTKLNRIQFLNKIRQKIHYPEGEILHSQGCNYESTYLFFMARER